MITMYYDDKCPVCRTEAIHMANKKPNDIRIIPVSQAVETLATFGISQIDAMTYLCISDEKGKMHTGMNAVRLLYKTAELPMVTVFNLPIVKQVSDFVYPIFARNRYRIPNWITQLIFGKVANENGEDICKNGVCRLPPSERLAND